MIVVSRNILTCFLLYATYACAFLFLNAYAAISSASGASFSIVLMNVSYEILEKFVFKVI